MNRPHFTHAQRAAVPTYPRFEARAVFDNGNYRQSQTLREFDIKPMCTWPPFEWGVYAIGGGHVEDLPTRTAAEARAAQLNNAR